MTDTGDSPPADVLDALGSDLRRALTSVRAQQCSLHDADLDVLWLSEGFLGPDEHGALARAQDAFAAPGGPVATVEDLGDGRQAIVRRLAAPDGTFLGCVLYLVDAAAARARAALVELDAPAVRSTFDRFAAWLARRRPTAPPATAPPASPPVLDTGATAIGRRLRYAVPASQVDPEVDRLFAALRRAEIRLHAQRVVPLAAPPGPDRYEVLLRSGPGAGVAPEKMLARASRARLASVIDRRVITTLLGALVRTRSKATTDVAAFSVNLSATALHDEHFGRFLELCLGKAALPAGALGFEVRETDALADPSGARTLATVLERLGAPLAIDDFTGSVAALELLRLPAVRTVKFDPRLTHSLAVDGAKLRALAELARTMRVLDVETVGKRIEEGADLQCAADAGVDYVQSFAMAEPVALERALGLPTTVRSATN
jgi:EAL domain-containing protein (putative c-di-GMP-specific phosphodiesterase class I)